MTARLSLDQPIPSANTWAAWHPPCVTRGEARAEVMAALAAQARKTAVRTVKEVARAYLDDPELLDKLRPGFVASLMTPKQLILFAKEVMARQFAIGSREFVPVQLILAKAAILYGRYERRYTKRKHSGGWPYRGLDQGRGK